MGTVVDALAGNDLRSALVALRTDLLWVRAEHLQVEQMLRGERTTMSYPLFDGRVHLAWTRGYLPTPLPGEVLVSVDLDFLAEILPDQALLCVDTDSVHEVRIDARRLRILLSRDNPAPSREVDRIWSLHQDSRPPELLHALACGAHRQVMNGEPWNEFGPWGSNVLARRTMLARDWGIESSQDWRAMLERLARDEPSQGDEVLAVRRSLAVHHGVVDVTVWVSALRFLAERAGVADTTTGAMVSEARRIDAYEGLLRERGLLSAAEQIPSLHAWDWARGANMARDGAVGALCDLNTSCREAVRFGRLIREHYTSWNEFGTAFTLGRLLWSYDRYDELVSWGSAVDLDRTLAFQRVLTTDPQSPWRYLPFSPAPSPWA